MGFNFRAAAQGFAFTHEETATGGTKFPRQVDTTVHHPETGEQVGTARYFPPKRRGGPIHIDDVRADAPGAGSAVLNEIESRHPGSSTKFLHQVKRNNNNPDKTGNSHANAGQPSDWDTHYPNLASTVHRGFSLRLPGWSPHTMNASAKVVNSSDSTKEQHLHELHAAIPQGQAVGMHWTEDEHAARQFAHNAVSDHRTDVPVVLHAQTPARKDIETRPDHLYRGGVFAYGDENSPENEVPYRKGRTVKVTGISWRPDAAHPDADEHGWMHHTYSEPMHHTAAAIEEEDDAGSVDRHDSDVVESTGPEEPEAMAGGETPASCSYCGSTAFEGLTDNGRVRQATCIACGGTMSAHDGAQWTPELIGDPSNHPSPNPDPRSGGVGGAGAASTDPLVRDQSRIGVLHMATPEDDEHVQNKMGLPLLKHGESYEDRLAKLTHHYTFLHDDDGTVDEPYMESRHPLSRHHEEHGVPHFDDNDHMSEEPDVKARIAAHLSRHMEVNPPQKPPRVGVVLPRHTATMEDSTYADYSPAMDDESHSVLRVNRKLARRPEDKPHVPDGSGVPRPSRGWLAGDDGDSSLLGRVLTHEHGHLRDEEAHNGISTDDHNHEGIKRREKMFEEISQHIPGASPYKSGNNVHHWLLDNREHVINHVSTYAGTNDKELVAELYAHHHHSPNPSKAASVVGRYLDGEEHHDDGSTHAGEAGIPTGRIEPEGAHPGSGAGHRESADPSEGAFRGRLAAKIPSATCDTCKGKGTVSWMDEDPDWQGDPDENPGKVHTDTCDDCDGKGRTPETSDEEVAERRKSFEDRLARGTAEHVRDKHPAGKLVTIDDVRGCGPRCPVGREWDKQQKPFHYTGAIDGPDWCTWRQASQCTFPNNRNSTLLAIPQVRGACPWTTRYEQQICPISEPGPMALMQSKGSAHTAALSWDEIGDRHPHVYGDSEIHGDAADGADGPGIGDAANYLAHERPGHHDAEDSSVHDLEFHEKTVHPRHIDYSPSGSDDLRVRRARQGYREHPDQMPPLVLVKRHDVYHVADGHHRAEAAHGLDMPVRAYVADSPHPDTPFADGNKGPSWDAKPIPKERAPRAPKPKQYDPDQLKLFGAVKTPCQTPGAQFHTTISDSKVGLMVDLHKNLDLNEAQATLLESNMHNAMEMVLRPYFEHTAMPSRKHSEHPEGISFSDHNGTEANEQQRFGDAFHQEGEETHPGWEHHYFKVHNGPHEPPYHGDNVAGTIFYSKTKEGDPAHPALAIHDMKVYEENKGKGYGSAMQDELRRQHPQHMFDHGGRSPAGQKWWDSYSDPGDPKLNLDHPDNAHLKEHYRPTELQRSLGDSNFYRESSLSAPQAHEFAKVARQDPEFGFHLTAAWSDVRNKAKRIRAEGKVQIKTATNEGLAGVVEGDHGAYDNMITYRPGTKKIADWHCDCKWGDWAWDRIRFHGRQCSHSLALQYEAQSRGMFGREVHLGALKFGAVEELDELPGLTDVPLQLIARSLTEADEDPADIMKILMAYGLPHSAARQLLIPVKESSIQVEADQEKMCQQCGHMLEEDAKHCPVCNAEVKDDFPDTFHDAALHEASPGLTAEEEDKRRKKHHHTVDTRRHAPNFGYGIPGWIGLPIGICGQCTGWGCGHCGGTGQVAQDGNGNTADAVPDQNGDEGQMMSGGISDTSSLRTAKENGPTVSGVALKAADTGRVLMLQRGLDEDHPAAGKWEFPGGHHEEGDTTSLHAGIREWQEEVGQPFPEGGTVHHTWTSPDGVYQGHVVVIPSEKDLAMHQGRVVPNPDDPKGDQHEQAAWWDIDHAKGNKVLRDEVKTHTPWKEIANAGVQKTASTWDALSSEDDTPGFPYAAPLHSNSQNPGSTGWATSEDPKDWTSESEIPGHLLPESSYYATLHEVPEPALPSTDGAVEDEVPETNSSISDPSSSLTPNQFTGSVQDVVARFQMTAGAQGIMSGTPEKQSGGEMSFDYAAAARQYLAQGKGLQKAALKDFSFPEQQELINEGKREDVRARNFGSLQIEGTHYEALNRALGLHDEDPEELFT